MVEKKTARLLEASTAIGALVAMGNDQTVDALSRFGYNIGMAYQVQDDLLDSFADEQVVGKSIGIDTTNKRQTFLRLAYSDGGDMLVTGHDSQERLAMLINQYTRQAHEALAILPLTPARQYLSSLADSLVHRRC
jgi:geranylgeranyl pyrophosphate synthase